MRWPHAESNYGVQVAAEYCADTSPLIQMLEKGHHNVSLDEEAWDRLFVWIDLGAPDQGSWKNREWGVSDNFYQRRLEMLKRFAGRTDDAEWLPPSATAGFINYTNYVRGINGIIIDVGGLAGSPTAADFQFKIGNDNDPTRNATTTRLHGSPTSNERATKHGKQASG